MPVAPERVAIVGGGIAGSSAAWFLKDAPGLRITLFEGKRVGGRVQEIQFPKTDPIMVETGGAAIHSANEHMGHFIDALGLHRDTSTHAARTRGLAADDESHAAETGGVASWDGQHLTSVGALSFPLSLLQARRVVGDVIGRWEHIYRLQAQNISFESPLEMLRSLGVAELANVSADAWLKSHGLSSRFRRQFVDGVSRINYGQDASINAFAEAVSLAGAGLVGSLYSVKEGNAKVMEGLVKASGATLRLERVTAVRLGKANGSSSEYELCVEGGECEFFDSVVLAAPLELAGLKLDKALQPEAAERPYQETVATFVAAEGLSSEFFKSKDTEVHADTVMTTAASDIPFNSVAVHGVSGGRKVYKLFTRQSPSDHLLQDMFVNMSVERAEFAWRAYPVLHPSQRWPPFRLHRSPHGGGVYYVNAMESPASCMETEAVGAKNVALLLLDDRKKRDNVKDVKILV